MEWPALGTYVFGAAGHVVVHALPGSGLAALHDSYTRGVVPVVMLARDCEALHASAVLAGTGVTAFCAVSGTGKSSLARAVAGGVFTHWADDTVVLTFDTARARSVALPCAPRLDAAAASAIQSPPDVASAAPGTTAPLARVYLVRRDPDLDPTAPVVTPVRGSASFERLLAHAHPFDLSTDDRRRRAIDRLLHVAATTPIFELRFAPSLAHLLHLAAVVRTHLDTSP
jgi:hypothetical protein